MIENESKGERKGERKREGVSVCVCVCVQSTETSATARQSVLEPGMDLLQGPEQAPQTIGARLLWQLSHI